MRIRRIQIDRFRGLKELHIAPTARTVILGPNNAGKTTLLEALDLLLHSGRGRGRPPPSEIDYYGRDPEAGFQIETVIGDLPEDFLKDVHRFMEGWHAETETLHPEVDGNGLEPVIRVRVRGTKDFELRHEFAKDEAEGASFHPTYRSAIGWVFDGRARDPGYQLAFYQGGILDRLFADVELAPAIVQLRTALSAGANSVNADAVVAKKLLELAADLQSLGLISNLEMPAFETGAISARELLQSLRLTLPGAEVPIPLSRHGRGTQRLLLVTVLLRLAQAAGRPVIGGFEEPEEALEPIRQHQIARILSGIADKGQIFVVTHSPEIARAFLVEDFVLLNERTGGLDARPLRKHLSESVRQKYERWTDGAVIRALFSRVPILVEGPSDRAVFGVFWSELAKMPPSKGGVRPREQLGLDFINCEGAPEFRMMAQLLQQAGKPVGVIVEGDRPDVVEGLREDKTCRCLVLYESTPGRQNLEQLLALSASLKGLVAALSALAWNRGYTWTEQRECLVSAMEGVESSMREKAKSCDTIEDAFGVLPEASARGLAAKLLGAKSVTPFEAKGARQGRIVAETIIAVDGRVPAPFAKMLQSIELWVTKSDIVEVLLTL
jgi:putative ATP-dependent endonuclease of OLD family